MRIAYASLSAFKAKANLLASLLKLDKRKHGLDLLARVSGYANYLEVSRSDVTVGRLTLNQVVRQILAARPETGETEARRIAEALALHDVGERPAMPPQADQGKPFDKKVQAGSDVPGPLKDLAAYLQQISSCAAMSLADPDWARRAGIPGRAGWYFVRTTAPLEVLQRQALWAATYLRKDGGTAKVKNYDIAARAARIQQDLQPYWNATDVYSGIASNLLARAREHSFPDPGTGGLALARYPELHEYDWHFHFVTMERFHSQTSCPEMLLRLGEQMWRAANGWPVLCSE